MQVDRIVHRDRDILGGTTSFSFWPMRVLLDEQPYGPFCGTPRSYRVYCGRPQLGGHQERRVTAPHERLLVLVTMDRSIEFQQRIASLPFGIVLVHPVQPLADLKPLVPLMGTAFLAIKPGLVQQVGA